MRVSAAEAEPLAGGINANRKSWADLRPVILICSFLALYLGLDLGAGAFGPAVGGDHWDLTAGLSFALLLAYGIRYAPLVLVASLVNELWLHPSAIPFPYAVLRCLVMTMVHAMAAEAVRRLSGRSSVNLRFGRDVPRFLIGASMLSAVLAAASFGGGLLEGARQNIEPMLELRTRLIGFATGIFALTPFLLIYARPWFDRILAGANLEKLDPGRILRIRGMDRPATVFALSFLALVGVVFWQILGEGVTDGLFVLLLFTLPLGWVAVHRGVEGLALAVPVMVGINMVAPWRLGMSLDSAGVLQGILIIAVINSYMIGSGVTQLSATGQQLERRDAILDAVSYAATQFIGKGSWEQGLQDVMRRLGEATAVHRVFIIERVSERTGQSGGKWMYEWAAQGLSMDENDKSVLGVLRGQLIEEQSNILAQGHPAVLVTKGMDAKKREMLEALGVRSVVIVPMFVDHQWWGCLGLEQCFFEREWPVPEIDGLKMAGHILGTLIASFRVEQQFRQLTGNIQAVFWISGSDGQAKQYVSPGYEEIWGRTCTSLHRQPRSWLEAIHVEDQNRVFDALVKQAWGEYDEEYRVTRPDQSIRWVRDRAFPVRDQAGQVYRIVGIAEDITEQKKTEEQLRAATVLLSSLIDHLQSGIVVEDEDRRITHVNQSFINMFKIPVPPQSLFGMDSRLLFIQPCEFSQRIESIIGAGKPVMGEELQWQDRLFLRFYVPLFIGYEYRYHLWQYRDVTDSRHAEEQIKSSLKEKEVLLKEIHHRVKNNLQIICSLLNLQSNEIGDPAACQKFKESQDRVKAMALIHERLYQSGDLAKIDFAGYVRNLTGHLLRSYRANSSSVRLNLDIDPVPMNLDVAIPCGLIINELVSNSLKYAFPANNGGEISIRFADENGQGLRLTVRDNGVGMPPDTDLENSQSLGLKLVRSLTDQLGGVVNYRSQNGLLCDIQIARSRT